MSKSRNREGGRDARKSTGGPRPGKDRSQGDEAHLPWKRRNFILLTVAGGLLVVGFLLLALGDTTIAPILLVGAYLGVIPWAITSSSREGGRPDTDISP